MAIKAKRTNTKLRIALTGPTNAGKTYSALRLAYGMIKAMHPEYNEEQIWDKIYLIDTERGRGLAYADRDDLPLKTGSYWYGAIDAPYTPAKYVEALKDAMDTVGTDGVIIVDSLSHAWNGEGGVLDIKAKMDEKNPTAKYTGWNEVGKLQNNMIDNFLNTPSHTIFTMRSKMAYELQQDENGKNRPVKLGLAPVQRGDLEYEFDITLMLNKDHYVEHIVKDITFLENQGYDEILDEQLGMKLIEWCEKGVSPKVFEDKQKEELIEQIKSLGNANPPLFGYFKTKFGPDATLTDLTLTQLKNLLKEFKEMV